MSETTMTEKAAVSPIPLQFVDAAARRKTIDLAYPVAYDGRT
jgi:hypothetical protein